MKILKTSVKESQILLLIGLNFMFITELSAYGYNFYYIIDEELNVGSIIGELKKDFLQKHNKKELLVDTPSSLKFYLSPSSRNHNNYFHLDNATGILYNKDIFDREVLCKPGGSIPLCRFTVIVQVTPKTYFAILKIVVEIKDINDNSPKFVTSKYNFEISDQINRGQSFQLPTAQDDDADSYGIENYFIKEDTSDPIFLDIFKLINHKMVDGSFDVRLEVKNNRLNGTKSKSISGEIMVVDKGIPARTDVLSVVVTIKITYDAEPQFEVPLYRFFVTENSSMGTFIGRVKSNAMSYASNYFIQDHSSRFRKLPFTINSKSGEIYVNGSVDNEIEKSYRFNVVILPQVPFDSASVIVDVLVIDVNDCSPKILINALTPNNRAQLKENSPEGTLIAQVRVSNEDGDLRDKFTCYAQSSYFILDTINISTSIQEYKLLSATTFDREEISKHDVQIVCEGLGDSDLNSKIMVFVDIIDENDNSPFFPKKDYVVDLNENTQSGLTPLMKFQASDIDEGQNAVLTYHLSSLDSNSTYSHLFYIDELDGIVYSQHTFDYENDQQYFVFIIRAVDSGEIKLTGTTTLTLNIVDLNDHSPSFTQNVIEFQVLRSKACEGNVIGVVNSSDDDKSPVNSRIIYAIEGASQDSYFNIDPFSGELSWTKTPIDEFKFEFNVIASNAFSLHVLDTSVLVIIQINDMQEIILANERAESDVHAFTGPVHKGIPIFQVKVKNGNLISPRFQFVSGNDENKFEIDPKSGIIIATKETEQGLSFFNFTLLIVDENMIFEQTTLQLPIFVNNTGNHNQDNFMRIWIQNHDIVLLLVCIIVTVVLILFMTALLLTMKSKRTKRLERIMTKDLDATQNMIVVPNFYESKKDQLKDRSLRNGPNLSIVNLEKERDGRHLYTIIHSDGSCDPCVICSKIPGESIRKEDTSMSNSIKGTNHYITHSLNNDSKLFKDVKRDFSQPVNTEILNQYTRFSLMCLKNSNITHLEPFHAFKIIEDQKENCELCLMDKERKKIDSNGISIISTV